MGLGIDTALDASCEDPSGPFVLSVGVAWALGIVHQDFDVTCYYACLFFACISFVMGGKRSRRSGMRRRVWIEVK